MSSQNRKTPRKRAGILVAVVAALAFLAAFVVPAASPAGSATAPPTASAAVSCQKGEETTYDVKAKKFFYRAYVRCKGKGKYRVKAYGSIAGIKIGKPLYGPWQAAEGKDFGDRSRTKWLASPWRFKAKHISVETK